MTRREFVKRTLFSCGLTLAGVSIYTWRWEPHWVEFVLKPLPIKNLPNNWNGKRLIQITDLHIGPRVSDAFLLQTFKETKSYSPEIVVYTGDFTSYERDIFSHAESIFPHLPTGSRATLGVLGNHDYGPNWAHPKVADRLAAIAREAGVNILRNEVADLDGLLVAGLDDLWAERFSPERPLAGLGANNAGLVLSHNPDTADEPVWGNYDGWILAGHTHGGQCKPPFLPAPLLPVKNRRYTAGEINLEGGRKMYINRGLGHLLQVRFNVRPEITVFALQSI
jgi:uncharacterized protein